MVFLLRLLLLGPLAFLVLLGWSGTWLAAEQAQHFRPQVAALALLGLAAALLLRRPSEAAAAALLVALVGGPVVAASLPPAVERAAETIELRLIEGATAAHPAPRPAGAGPRRLTLVAANVYHLNPAPDRLVDRLLAADADVLVLTEVTRNWPALQTRLKAAYPYRTPGLWLNETSTIVWSRYPMSGDPDELRQRGDRFVLDTTLDVDGRPLRVFGLHAPRPRSPDSMGRRDRLFGELRDWVAEREVATVLAGDFNATPWTPALAQLIDGAGLERAKPASGWYASWPGVLGDLGIPIDHLLHDARVRVESLRAFDLPGSDHRGIEVRLLLPRAPAGTSAAGPSGGFPCAPRLATLAANPRTNPRRRPAMNADDLRQMQQPIKARYKEDPEAAVVTLKASGRVDDSSLVCKVDTGKALVEAGLHPATGGSGQEACSGDMLLEALVACAGVTLRAVATALGIELRSGTVTAEGELDFRGTLGVDKAAPVGFRDIRLSFDIDCDADQEQRDSLLKLTERYCVIYQTLRNAPPIAVAMTPAESAAAE